MSRKLKVILKKHSGRDSTGQVTMRHQGGRQKRYLRTIDFKRDKKDILARVISIERDPNRTSQIALLFYKDGEKRYILQPEDLQVGDWVISSKDADIRSGNCLPLKNIPIGTVIHNIELAAGAGGKLVRGAGQGATIIAKEGDYAQVRMPSGEIRLINLLCWATVGSLGNAGLKERKLGKAGRKILMGIRPTVRGVAQNPRSHPHGGGEGRSGIGMKRPKTYAGRPAVGKTRKRKKYSNKSIIKRRK